MNIKIEYSPVNGQFRCTKVGDPTDETNGFKTICEDINLETADHFTEQVAVKYPNLSQGNAQEFPSVLDIKKEFYAFALQETRESEEQMNAIYQRRKKILSVTKH